MTPVSPQDGTNIITTCKTSQNGRPVDNTVTPSATTLLHHLEPAVSTTEQKIVTVQSQVSTNIITTRKTSQKGRAVDNPVTPSATTSLHHVEPAVSTPKPKTAKASPETVSCI